MVDGTCSRVLGRESPFSFEYSRRGKTNEGLLEVIGVSPLRDLYSWPISTVAWAVISYRVPRLRPSDDVPALSFWQSYWIVIALPVARGKATSKDEGAGR